MAVSKKFLPGSDAYAEDIFDFPFLEDTATIQYIQNHGKIMFIVRGPPGTGKNTLKQLIIQHYKGIPCSADDYFTKTFNSAMRTRDSMKKSHEYCHRKVKQECAKGTHPVIVSNTHMKRFEMQDYLNFAADYGYTVIITNTMDKFEVSPEILARSNTKGLTKEYFERRLLQFENVYPILTGWFLCLDDAYFILNQLQSALSALLGDGKFCRVFNAFDNDELLGRYQAKEVLFSIAGYSKNSPFELEDYYQSAEVKASYGKSFRIVIQAFLITESDILAIVQSDDSIKHLVFETDSAQNFQADEDDMNDILNRFQSLSLKNTYNFKTIPLKNDFLKEIKSAVLEDSASDILTIKKSSFIHLAQKGMNPYSVWKNMCLFKNSFSGCTNSSGGLLLDSASELEGGYKMFRLQKDRWLVKPPKNISVSTIFTGLYI